MLLPPGAGEGWDGGHMQAACGQALHPHPGPPPSQGEGSLCANLTWSNLEIEIIHPHGLRHNDNLDRLTDALAHDPKRLCNILQGELVGHQIGSAHPPLGC
jgi:hypothetical protein